MITLMKRCNVLVRLGIAAMLLTSSAGAQHAALANQSGGAKGAPEIDVALAGAAFALVIGGLFVFTAVRRKRLARS